MYPSVITTFTNPNANNRLNAPSHSSIESAQNNGLTQVMNFVGTEGSSSTLGTLIYDARSPASNGGGHVQTANKGGTGQTNYNQGDILVGQSSSVLAKLASAGNPDGYALILDSTQATGIKWGTPGNVPIRTVYANPSIMTWVRPSIFSYIIVEVIGTGGGGGAGTGVGVAGKVGGGGGAGGYASKIIPASSLLGSQNFVVAGSVAGGTAGGTGATGNRSSFGTVSILSASGGIGGSSNQVGTGGAGGVGSGGDINGIGPEGTSGIGYLTGSNFIPAAGGTAGYSQYGFGPGGDGATNGNGNTSGNGVVIITQY